MMRKSPRPTAKLMAANRANAQKSTGPRTSRGKQRTLANLKRHFGRLVGVPEALALDQEPGAAIHLYEELIAPYEPAPALLAMHFRDLARLQLELQAWEGIRDAQMKYRAEQAMLAPHRRRLEMTRELRATFGEILDTGLCRMNDSCGKFNAQCDALWAIGELVKLGRLADLTVPLSRLYGIKLEADTECGRMICALAERLMKRRATRSVAPRDETPGGNSPSTGTNQPAPEGRESAQQSPKPAQQSQQLAQGGDESGREDLEELMVLVHAEERKVMAAWEVALYENRVTSASSQASLAPTREDHWMNRQGDRLRQAIDRKMRFTPILLKMLGLSHRRQPVELASGPEEPEICEKNIHTPKPECGIESTT